jgi:hypothetical protein
MLTKVFVIRMIDFVGLVLTTSLKPLSRSRSRSSLIAGVDSID